MTHCFNFVVEDNRRIAKQVSLFMLNQYIVTQILVFFTIKSFKLPNICMDDRDFPTVSLCGYFDNTGDQKDKKDETKSQSR